MNHKNYGKSNIKFNIIYHDISVQKYLQICKFNPLSLQLMDFIGKYDFYIKKMII